MIYFISIFVLISLIGILLSFKYKGLSHKIIAIGIPLSITIGLLEPFIGVFLRLAFAIFTGIYGIRLKSSDLLLRITVGLMGFLYATALFVSIQHLPGANILRLVLELPVLLYLFHLIRNRSITKEFSFMIIWLFLAISYFIGVFY